MPPLRTLLALPVSLALLALAPAASPAPAIPSAGAVLPLLVTRGGAPAAALLASDVTGRRHARAGSGIARADHFRAGSITKTFIATVVLQLAEERRLSLSDSVERHLPGLVRGAGNDGRALTLRSLLTHTSGLHDFATDTRNSVPVTPLQAVRIALTHPPAAPGRFAYSNTNYVLLGLIVEHVTGRSYADETERRVITPLGLKGTSFPGSRTALPRPHGRSYAADGTDVTRLDPRVAGAAGELVTRSSDSRSPHRSREATATGATVAEGTATGDTAATTAPLRPARLRRHRDGRHGHRGTTSGAPSRAASAVRSSGCRWDSRSASTRFS